jgi:hypothetical protein
MINEYGAGSRRELAEKLKYLRRTCPSDISSTKNRTWPDMRSNPVRRGGKPATNPLSTALKVETKYV